MPKRHLTICLVIVVCFILAGSSQCQNLLSNPSFEGFPVGLTYTNGTWLLDGWRYFSVNGANGVFETVYDAQDGNRAVKLTRGSTSGDSGLDRDDPALRIPVTAGHSYVGSVWAKTATGSSMIVIIAAYDANGQWMQTQKSQSFTLTQSYSKCTVVYTPPAGTAAVNFAIRVNGTGTITVDDCGLIDVTRPPTTPTITYPCNEMVDSLKPVIAFAGYLHTGYQVIITRDEAVVWDSGEVVSSAFTISCPVSLQPSASYQVKVRLQNGDAWGAYCDPVTFTTPDIPVVKITSHSEADQVRGPSSTLRWTVESPSSVTLQKVTLNGKTPVTLTNTARSYAMNNLAEGVHSVTLFVTSGGKTVENTVRFYVRITPSSSGTIYFYDLSYTLNYSRSDPYQLGLSYDIPMAVVALQGLVNRNGPRLFIKMSSADDTWLTRMRASGNWLNGKTLVTIPTGYGSLVTLFNTFKDDYKGVVLWDPNVRATSNVATTISGADDLIPVRYDVAPGSVYNTLVTSGPNIPVQLDLCGKFTGTGTIWGTNIPSTGSKKCDAYVWARNKYLETGKSNPNLLFYGIDAYSMVNNAGGAQSSMLANRDYVVQNKGFALDLNVWGDERPIDDPDQPMGADLNTLKSILYAAAVRAQGMVELIGFVPWPVKYTNWTGAGGTLHEPVPSEWEQVRLCSLYNAYVDADAVAHNMEMANASIYSLFPYPERLAQNRKVSWTELRKLGYIDTNNVVSPFNYLNFYIGDYDSGSWVTRNGNDNWNDADRGNVPMSWAFNPNLIKRIGAVYEYYNRTRTANDFFIAGDSGAGYVHPAALIGPRASGLPSAHYTWVDHNLDYFRRTNVKITGFIINGTLGPITSTLDDVYSRFSVDGAFSQPGWYPQGNHFFGAMPALLQQRDLDWNVTPSVDIIQPKGVRYGVQFLNYRSIIRPPSWIKSVYNGIVTRDTTVLWRLVDTATYTALASCHMGKVPDFRATYTFDTIPSTIYGGVGYSCSIGIRNDGWVTWNSTGSNAVSLVLKWMRGAQIISSTTVAVPRDIESGAGIVLDLALTTPAEPGDYTLHYEMAKGGVAFTTRGDYAWENKVTVVASGGTTCNEAKSRQDGTLVVIADQTVTAGTDQFQYKFYIESSDRSSGIQVYTGSSSSISVVEGDKVSLTGTMSTFAGERRIINPTILFRQPRNSN